MSNTVKMTILLAVVPVWTARPVAMTTDRRREMIAQPHCPHRAAFRIHGRIDKFYCQACWWAPHNRPTRRPSRVTRCTDQVWHQCDGRPQPRDGHGEAQP